jgi:hypothetical protein
MVARPKAILAAVTDEGIQAEEDAQQLVPAMAMPPGEVGAVAVRTVQHAAILA